jgi:hypothetical protein
MLIKVMEKIMVMTMGIVMIMGIMEKREELDYVIGQRKKKVKKKEKSI